jgi:glycine cleavage system transcriptional repressor
MTFEAEPGSEEKRGAGSSGQGSFGQGVVLTAVGPDRPGIVSALAGLLHEAGANIEDTRMAKLGGEFAVLMLVTGSEPVLSAVLGQGARIESELGVKCTLAQTSKPAPTLDGLRYHLQVSGFDRPGIVQSVSSVLSRLDINVASLSSGVVHAPLTGTPMFLLDADLEVPRKVSLPALRRSVAEACERENLDFSLEPGRA